MTGHLLRLILRLILVPLGFAVAVAVAMAVLVGAYWNAFAVLINADPAQQQNWMIALFASGPFLLMVLAYAALMMMVPAVIFVAVAEAFAIRSWIYHALTGGLSALIGWAAISDIRDEYQFLTNPAVIVGAGLAAGFAYWMVAGWTSGFWKPLTQPPAQSPPV
jgi:hypothetical protein